MKANKLYAARVQVVEAMEQGLPWHEAAWADIRHEEVAWWQEGWQPNPAPAAPTEPKLIPIVTTAPCADTLELARAYIHRWPAQENVIRDWLIPLGLDYNHGYAKAPVVNSEVSKKREAVEKRLSNVQRFREAARIKAHRATLLSTRLRKEAKEHGERLYRDLNERLQALEAQGVTEGRYWVERRKQKADVDAELEAYRQRVYRVEAKSYQESSKHERYCRDLSLGTAAVSSDNRWTTYRCTCRACRTARVASDLLRAALPGALSRTWPELLCRG